MTIRKVSTLALCSLLLSGFAALSAQAQKSPFTITRPPDGSTVREKVQIVIPRGSIKQGGFVAFYLDDKFHVALSPQDLPANKPFVFVWNTKEEEVKDGEHNIKAVLYEPAGDVGGGSGIAVDEKASSEVRLTVANKIKNGPRSLVLRYKYRDGANLQYARGSKAIIVGGLSQNGLTTSDQTLNSVNSRLQFGIEDARPDVALVRNKMTSLAVLSQGQEFTVPQEQLSGSMYQEVTHRGEVKYETGDLNRFAEFAAIGLPIANTLELPELPESRITVGQTWFTSGQRLELPNIPPPLQPRVKVENKFEGLEWESGYPTARIRQTYKGSPVKTLQFGEIEVTAPTITYVRNIYIAYKSGTLVKTDNTLTVAGRTTSTIGMTEAPAAGGGMGGAMPGMGGMPGMNGMPGMGGGGMPGSMGGGRGARGPGMPGSMGGGGFRPPGMGGGSSMPGSMGGGSGGMRGRPGGMAGGGQMPGSMGGGMRGRPGGMSGSGMPGSMGGMSGRMGAKGGDGGGFGGAMPGFGGRQGGAAGGAGSQELDRPITLKALTETQLLGQGTGGI